MPTPRSLLFISSITAFSIFLGAGSASAAPLPQTQGLQVECEKTSYIARVQLSNRVCFDDADLCAYAAAYMNGSWFKPGDDHGGNWGNPTANAQQVECKSCAFTHNRAPSKCELKLLVGDGRGGVRRFSNEDSNWQLGAGPTCFPVKRSINHCLGDRAPRERTEYCINVTGEFGSGGAYCKSSFLCDLESQDPLEGMGMGRSSSLDQVDNVAICEPDSQADSISHESTTAIEIQASELEAHAMYGE